jgi:hypothetical protein
VEVVTGAAAHGTNDVQKQPRPVLERPPVLVVAVVDRGGEELREEIAVRAVQLDAVVLLL